MKLITKAARARLEANWRASAEHTHPETGDGETPDHRPVVKLFNAYGAGTWLISELDPDGTRAFGLCDMGMQSPEVGYVDLMELALLRFGPCQAIERDLQSPRGTLREYADAARAAGEIVQLPEPDFPLVVPAS